ncbi:MAG: N-formylglutamate amidohydrolase [Planctomycetota bacterium]
MSLLITCDGGGWKTPSRVRSRLESEGVSLPHAHIAGDRSALLAAMAIARITGGTLVANEHRPDLIDVGRTLGRGRLFGPEIACRPKTDRQLIVEEIYQPYRRKVREQIMISMARSAYVVHLSIRSFDAKEADGRWRRGDVGLGYDPAVQDEVDWCLDLIDELWVSTAELKVRRNFPRRGSHDTLTRAMRREFAGQPYLGIEVMLNRAWLCRTGIRRDRALAGLAEAIAVVTPIADSIAA